jgi:hypothetical protein
MLNRGIEILHFVQDDEYNDSGGRVDRIGAYIKTYLGIFIIK